MADATQLLALTVLFTLVFQRTSASVFVAVVFHTTFNAAENIVFEVLGQPEAADQARIYVWTVAAMVALAAMALPLLRNRTTATGSG